MSVSNSQVAHCFAHGKPATGSTFKTDGETLYSYYTAVAFRTVSPNGNIYIFRSSDSMTPTTGKQLSHIFRATFGTNITVIYTPAFEYGTRRTPTVAECLTAACHTLNGELERIARKRTSINSAIERFETTRAEIVAAYLEFNIPLPFISSVSDELRAKGATEEETAATRQQQQAARQAAQQARQRAVDMEQFYQWLDGVPGVPCPAVYTMRHEKTDYITVRGETVYTSRGAECPLTHAIAAVRFYMARETDNGIWTPYQTNGHTIHLGNFKLDRIDANGTVYAGCHVFTATEIKRFFCRWIDL